MPRLKMFIGFGIMVTAIVIVLKIFNWIPVAIGNDGVRRYRTIEDAETTLHFKRIFLPAYFPQYLKWPPSEIYAQRKPYNLILMQFTELNKSEIVLSIRQADQNDPSPLKSRLEPVRIDKKEDIDLKGRKASLTLATCEGGVPCNSIEWHDAGYAFKVTAKDSTRQIRKIAESMLAE